MYPLRIQVCGLSVASLVVVGCGWSSESTVQGNPSSSVGVPSEPLAVDLGGRASSANSSGEGVTPGASTRRTLESLGVDAHEARAAGPLPAPLQCATYKEPPYGVRIELQATYAVDDLGVLADAPGADPADHEVAPHVVLRDEVLRRVEGAARCAGLTRLDVDVEVLVVGDTLGLFAKTGEEGGCLAACLREASTTRLSVYRDYAISETWRVVGKVGI